MQSVPRPPEHAGPTTLSQPLLEHATCTNRAIRAGARWLVLIALLGGAPWTTAGARTEPLAGQPELSCGALHDAAGAKVNRHASSEPVGTSSTRRCPDAERPARQPPPSRQAAHSDAIPELSTEVSARRPGAQDGPLRFAAGNPERVGAALVTGGAMIWALHSGLWTSLLLLGVPLWRHVDLLPIVAGRHDDDACEPAPGPEEAAVARVIEADPAHPRAPPDPA